MVNRVLVALGALLIAISALVGVRFSGATWTDDSNTPVAVSAARDWTPPTVGFTTAVPAGVYGTSVTIAAQASDSLSSIASLTIAWSRDGGASWTALSGCTSSGTNSLSTTCTWNTTTVADGDYLLRASATDSEGNAASSAAASTSVANNGQAVLEPVAGAVRGVVTVIGHLYNAGNNGTTLGLAYKASSSSTWVSLLSATGCSAHDNPIACTWDTSSLPDGSYDVQLTTSLGLTDLQTGIIVDNHRPTAVTLTVPTGTLAGTQTLTASATDSPAGVGSMRFQYQLAGDTSWTDCAAPDTTAPYSCDLYTTTLTSGAAYSFRVVATDRAGNVEVSGSVQRTVDNSPASVTLTNPVTGSVLDGTVPVTAAAHAPSGVASVALQYRRVGAPSFATICSATASPYSCPWSTMSLFDGSYELRAVLTPGYGPTITSTTQTVSVDHTVGTVTLDPLSGGSSISGATTVTVTGSTSSTQGVSSVALKASPTSPSGPATTTPCTLGPGTFTCVWDVASVVYGEFDLRAEMTQGNGVVVTSPSPLHVTVDNVVASVTLGVTPTPQSAPANYVAGTESFSATTTSNLAVTKVAFSYRSSPSGTYQPLCPADTTAPYTCDWDTTQLSGGQPLFANGAYDVQAVMTLSNGSTRTTQTPTHLNVQNLRAVDVQGVQTTNSALETGESLTFTYSTRVDPGSLVTGWDGSGSAPISVSFVKGQPGGAPGATLTAGTLGQVVMAEDYVKTTNAYTGTAHVSLDPDDESKVVLTFDDSKLGSSFHFATGTGIMTWTPSASVIGYYAQGACSAAAVSESGTVDAEF